MANPFAQWAMPSAAPEEEVPVAAPAPVAAPPLPPPAAPDTPVVIDSDNPFQGLNPEQSPQMDTWSTKLRNKVVTFQAPRGATKEQIRAAAKAAGVPDPENRSLLFGEPAPKTKEELKQNSYGPIGTSVHQGVDFVLPIVDELAAGSTAAGQFLLGDTDFGGNYMNNMRYLEERAANSEELYPGEALGGKVGAFLASLPVAAQAKFLQGANTLKTSLRLGAFGAPYGGAAAYASNPVDERWNGVLEAAMLGGAFGLGTPILGATAGTIANRVDQRLGISDSMRRGWNALFGRPRSEDELANRAAVDVIAARVPRKPDEMREVADEFRAAGHDPTLVNVMDETGRGFVGAMARRPGPGRETAQRAYDARRLSAPERIDRNMAEVIAGTTDDPAVRAQLRRPADEILTDLTEKRSADIEAAMTPIRNQPVPLTPRMVEILDTADGRRAIARAMRTVTDPETLEAMKALPSLLKQVGKLDPRLPEAARQQIVDQLLQGKGLTVDIADRLARKFNALAKSADDDAAPALRAFAREIRDEAKAVSEPYRQAMEAYATSSKRIKAVETGEEFLTPKTSDEFVDRARKLETSTAAAGEPSERQLAMVGARRAVQRASGENISAAPGVARKIAVSPEQSARTGALFEPIDADRLERMMGITEKDLRDFAQIAPNTNSATALRTADDEMAAGALEAMARAKSGDVGGAMLSFLRSVGVRDQDAARIVQMATDPAQVDQLIDMLEASYGKQTAAKLSRALGLSATNVTGREVGGSR